MFFGNRQTEFDLLSDVRVLWMFARWRYYLQSTWALMQVKSTVVRCFRALF